MSAGRIAAVGAAALYLLAPATAARADDGSPGPQDLDLKVERLERTRQADVVGAEASAMLFVPADAATLAAAAEQRADARRAETAALFLADAVPLRAPVATDALFDAYAGGAAARDSADDDADAGAPWGAAGAGAVLLAGGGLSYVLRAEKGAGRG